MSVKMKDLDEIQGRLSRDEIDGHLSRKDIDI